MILRTTVLSLFLVLGVRSQENAATSVSKSLMECYNKTENLDREIRPPASMNVLIDLIRRVESGPSIQNDREFAIELIHRFKQDGIVRTGKTSNSPYSVPYTPKGMQADKNRLLLRKFVPGNSLEFPIESLTEVQRCSLHFMLSDSVDAWQRGDENLVCNKLGRFQMRMRRDVNPDEEVETFNPSNSSPLRGNLEEGEFEEETPVSEDQVDTDVDTRGSSSRKTITITLSDCPVENGAVYSRWGSVQAGTVIAAIAAGRAPQNVVSKEEEYVVDNRHAVTLAGDLAEVTLHQGVDGKQSISMGAKGGWKNIQVPRWYFINKNTDWQMTDAEIRGGLDGLIIAKNIADWKLKFPSLKLSQLLDLYYYSPRGVFSTKYRACNRKQLFTEVAPEQELVKQTVGLGLLLDDEAKLLGSISSEGIKVYGKQAVTALIDYIPRMADLSCSVEDDTAERASTDVIIVLDSKWDYTFIQKALGYMLDNLDVNKYGSNYTVINAQTGDVLVSSTASLIDFYSNYTKTVHLSGPAGFNANNAFNAVEKLSKEKMEDDKRVKKAGGQSSTVLFVLYDALSSTDKSTANSRKSSFKTYLPDLKQLVLGRNSRDAYADMVTDPDYDVFELADSSSDSSITQTIKALVSRTKEIPRKLVNPNCGSFWSGIISSETLEQYVEPNGINYYRVAPQYLFGEGTKNIIVQGYSYGNLVACTSRQNAKPSQNITEGDIKCETITASNQVTFSLTGGCEDPSSCPALYISVKSTDNVAETINPRCTDSGCRFPDSIKYSFKLQGLECANAGAFGIIGNVVLSIAMLLSLRFVF